MTQLEIDIQILEGTIRTLNDMIAKLDVSTATAIIQQRDLLEQELNIKTLQLNAQSDETIYEHLSKRNDQGTMIHFEAL